jgi:hypothetical protein
MSGMQTSSTWGIQAALSDIRHCVGAVRPVLLQIKASSASGVERVQRMGQDMAMLEDELSWEGDISAL